MAADDNGGIGLNNKLPWHKPEDLQWFKEMTMGGIVVIGHNTANYMPSRLPGRRLWIMDRSATPEEMIEKRDKIERLYYPDALMPLWIAGGAKTYAKWMPFIERFYIARIPGIHDTDITSPFPLPWLKS